MLMEALTSLLSTLVTEFAIACDRDKVPVINSAYMLGLALGSIVFGFVSDKLGRRKALFAAIITSTLSSMIASLSVKYEMYVFMRGLVGTGAEGW